MLLDMEGISRSMLLLCLLCLISLTNANSSPEITQIVYHVCEDTPLGETAFNILASDPEGDKLTYSLTGADAGYFNLDTNTGRVTVIRQLDREAANVLKPVAVVSDPANSSPSRALTVIVDEANDNKPIFQLPSYDVNINENAPVGDTLFTVSATDADTGNGSIVYYSIDDVSPSAGFSLFSIGRTNGEVILDQPLNYTELGTFYRLKINATDGGGNCFYKDQTTYQSSIVFAFIMVMDIPDLDPQFIGVPYIGSVKENSPKGQSVFKVTATDQDIGISADIIYSIEDSTVGGLFNISEDNGVISVLSEIDRDVIGDTVTLTVKATESIENIYGEYASTTANVQINIIDINDNRPEFYKCGDSGACVKASEFTGEVFEHSLGSIFINMTVKDLDVLSSTQLTLGGEDKNVFSVQPPFTMTDSIVQLVVKDPQKLDFEHKQEMFVEVIAIDEEETTFKSIAKVTLTIMDTNDNSPVFPEDTYKLNVSEHSPVGTIIANITAEDPDTMDQGSITYRLLPESILTYFDVEPSTGIVYVKNKILLDREVRSLFSVTLQAIDTDGKPGSTVLEITVTDINDQPPVINRQSYLEFVDEGGQFELKIEATDADDSETENSQIVYAIMPSQYSDNFTIDPNTGVLRNIGELDREALDPKLNGRIELNVTATDKGTPPLSSMVPVTIDVEDVNDNVPQFAASSYTFSVKEGERGAYVGTVYAEDLDQTTDFNRISFSIISGSLASFVIRAIAEERGYAGRITVDPDIELDYESLSKQFNLVVEATDLGDKKATVNVVVNVLDVNDERPEFGATGPIQVAENITEGIWNFIGYDKDGNHSLVYELESMKCKCNGYEDMIPCDSFILASTGEVRLNPGKTLDYEQCHQVVIEAQVVDEFTEKGKNNSVTTGKMVINIEDVNDNAPEFILSDPVFFVVSELASKGTMVGKVTATDRDSGKNSEIDFKVAQVKFKNNNNQTNPMKMLFEAVTTQQNGIYIGIIQTTETLDMTLKGSYLVDVTATDSGGLSNSTVLEIFTVDESYKVELEFTLSVAELESKQEEIVRELSAATKTTVQIVATRPATSEASRASVNTIIVAYFVYSNGTALTSNEVEKMLSDPQYYIILTGLGLKNIGDAPDFEAETNPVQYILIGLMAGLILLLVVLTTSLLCTRRKYQRKLKASKAMNSASMVTSDNQKGGAVVPGTNKYTMEGANPVLNLNYDTTMALDIDEESVDVDKASLSSMEYGDDMVSEMAKTSRVMMRRDDNHGSRDYTEALGAALAHRGQDKGSVNSDKSFDNPIFTHTDL